MERNLGFVIKRFIICKKIHFFEVYVIGGHISTQAKLA